MTHPDRDALLAILMGRARVGLDAQDPRFGALYRLQRVAKQDQEDAVEMIRIGAHGRVLVHAVLPARRAHRGEGVAGRVDGGAGIGRAAFSIRSGETTELEVPVKPEE